jgi:hypothetical protein
MSLTEARMSSRAGDRAPGCGLLARDLPIWCTAVGFIAGIAMPMSAGRFIVTPVSPRWIVYLLESGLVGYLGANLYRQQFDRQRLLERGRRVGACAVCLLPPGASRAAQDAQGARRMDATGR